MLDFLPIVWICVTALNVVTTATTFDRGWISVRLTVLSAVVLLDCWPLQDMIKSPSRTNWPPHLVRPPATMYDPYVVISSINFYFLYPQRPVETSGSLVKKRSLTRCYAVPCIIGEIREGGALLFSLVRKTIQIVIPVKVISKKIRQVAKCYRRSNTEGIMTFSCWEKISPWPMMPVANILHRKRQRCALLYFWSLRKTNKQIIYVQNSKLLEKFKKTKIVIFLTDVYFV